MLENFNIKRISGTSDANKDCQHVWIPISELTTPDLEFKLLRSGVSCFGKTICAVCQAFGEITNSKKSN